MSESELKIDESTHKRVPAVTERFVNALVAVLLGFLLVQIIGFWMFPGLGLSAIHTISYQPFDLIGQLMNIYIIAFLSVCGVMGWFQGMYFIDRLKGYLNFWKFW